MTTDRILLSLIIAGTVGLASLASVAGQPTRQQIKAARAEYRAALKEESAQSKTGEIPEQAAPPPYRGGVTR